MNPYAGLEEPTTSSSNRDRGTGGNAGAPVTLAGRTQRTEDTMATTIYYDDEHAKRDGLGWNVVTKGTSVVARFATAPEALTYANDQQLPIWVDGDPVDVGIHYDDDKGWQITKEVLTARGDGAGRRGGVATALDDGAAGVCRHCERAIKLDGDGWIDPEATGDDSIWRETCDAHDTFIANHEPQL